MFELPIPEIILFLFVIVTYIAAAIIGLLQLLAHGERYKRFLSPIVCLGVTLEAVFLIFRAVEIKAIPLTGMFESMIVLTIVFGVLYLFFSIAFQQVWFGSITVWVILAMILLAGGVARPASEPDSVATTPWAIAHGIAMVIAGASIAFSTASAFLFLLGSEKLKHKKISQVLGRIPNIEKLKKLNLLGLKVCFILLTFGLASGAGLAIVQSAALEMRFIDWITDPKIVLIIAAWGFLGTILLLRRVLGLKDKIVAYTTMVVFFLILFAIAGVAVFCGTKHDFTADKIKTINTINEVQK